MYAVTNWVVWTNNTPAGTTNTWSVTVAAVWDCPTNMAQCCSAQTLVRMHQSINGACTTAGSSSPVNINFGSGGVTLGASDTATGCAQYITGAATNAPVNLVVTVTVATGVYP